MAFIYEHKIPQDKKLYAINEILDRFKDNLSDDELNRISNSYDEICFTPLLKLMYENNNNENPDYIDFSSLFKSNYSLNKEQTKDEYK